MRLFGLILAVLAVSATALLVSGCEGVRGLDTSPPSPPIGLKAESSFNFSSQDIEVELKWDDNAERDLVGYNVYRANPTRARELEKRNSSDTADDYSYLQLNNSPISDSGYMDADQLINDKIYYYKVTAADTAGNESAPSYRIRVRPFFDYPFINWGWKADP